MHKHYVHRTCECVYGCIKAKDSDTNVWREKKFAGKSVCAALFA